MRRLVAALAVAAVAVPACSKTVTPGGTTTTEAPALGVTNPSRAELEEVSGIRFPDSVADYRSVQVGPGGVDVAATVAAADVATMVEESGFAPLAAERVIAHSSPVWALNPGEVVAGTILRRDGVEVALEVVGDDDPRSIRVSVRAT